MSNESNFPAWPVYDSPFGDQSIFAETDDYFDLIDFQRLFKAITANRGKTIDYSPELFSSRAFRTYKIPDKLLVTNDQKSLISEDNDTKPGETFKAGFEDYLPVFKEKINKPYTDPVTNKEYYFEGLLNKESGSVTLDTDHVGFSFELDVKQKKISFTDKFHYTGNSPDHLTKIAFVVTASYYDAYMQLSLAEGMDLSLSSRKFIISKFADAFAANKETTGSLVWLYQCAPYFVLKNRSLALIAADIVRILKGFVPEKIENIILKLLNLFMDASKENKDYLLSTLQAPADKTTGFELLYSGMNDWGGADNFSAAILALYVIWIGSSFSDPAHYQYSAPNTLPYQSKKIFGFYESNYDFIFGKGTVKVNTKPGYIDDKVLPEPVISVAEYQFFQPLYLAAMTEDGEIKLPDTTIPAFYLKAFDDKNKWENFEKSVWIAVDVITTFTGVGNLLKLRYLVYTFKAVKYIRIALGTLQVATSVARLMLNFVDNCKEGTFCNKLRTYLFWLDLATVSADLFTEKTMRQSARNAYKESKITKIDKELEKHLEDVGYSTFNSKADPVADLLGPGIKSHP